MSQRGGRYPPSEAAGRIFGFVLVVAVVVVLVIPYGAAAQVPFADADIRGYATGTVVHADALESDGTRVSDAEEAFSGAAVDADGLRSALQNEMDRQIHPAMAADNTFGRGSGLEVGLGVTPTDPNQIILAGLAEAAAPPSTDLVTQELGPVPASPLAWASTVRGQAQARWDPGGNCIDGDLSFGLGFAADAQLLNAGEDNADGSMQEPVVAADARSPERAVSQSMSHTLLVGQIGREGRVIGRDFGLMSETRMTIAPVTLFKSTDSELTIEVLGEWVLQAVATGLNAGAYIHYGPGEVSPETPILRTINAAGDVTNIVRFQDILGDEGLVIDVPGVAEIAIGEDPRAIDGNADSAPTELGNGTRAAGAVDVVRVKLLEQRDDQGNVSFRASDLRVGHMEVRSQVPQGGISCELPVDKVAIPPAVLVGRTFVTRITVNNPFNCDLRNVRVEDRIRTEQNARFQIVSTDPEADQSPSGSSLASGLIVWNDIGPIGPGQSKAVEVTLRAQGGNGRIIDIAEATGTLANCRGEGGSVAGVASAVEGAGIQGQSPPVTVRVGAVLPLPPTGLADRAPLIAGIALLAGATLGGVMLRIRRGGSM